MNQAMQNQEQMEPKTLKILILKPFIVPNLGKFTEGQIVSLDKELAQSFILRGIAKVHEQKEEKAKEHKASKNKK